jgi:hypothetical protein
MMRRLLLLLLIGELLWTLPAEATILFQDGFENTLASNGWDTSSCMYIRSSGSPWPDGCNPTRSTDVAHSGSYSLKGDYNGPLYPDGGAGIKGVNIQYYNTHGLKEYWYRVYILTSSNVVYIPSGSVKQIYDYSSGSGYPSLVWEHEYGQGWVGVAPQGINEACPPPGSGQGSCFFFPQTYVVPPANTWACYEMHMKYNTPGVANGAVEIFVNGQQTLGYYNQTFVTAVGQNVGYGDTSGASLASFKIITQGGLSSGAIYYDDFAFGDARIGCAAAPGSGTTPPAAPTGLIIR